MSELTLSDRAFFQRQSWILHTTDLIACPVEEILAKTPPTLGVDDRGLLEVAHRNSLRLLRLVNTLLDYSRVEAGRMQASYEPVALALLTADLVEFWVGMRPGWSAARRALSAASTTCLCWSRHVGEDRT
jgi:signal transduction histidine kinase